MASVLDSPLTLLPDQPTWPPPDPNATGDQTTDPNATPTDQTVPSTDQGTRPVNPGDVAIAQSMNPPAQPTPPGQGGNTGQSTDRSLAANSSTFKPLVAADPNNKDDVQLIDNFNRYMASGQSIDDLSPSTWAAVNNATGAKGRDDIINNDPELFYQLKFKPGKYTPQLLDEIGNPTNWPQMALGFIKSPFEMVGSVIKGIWDTTKQDFDRGDVVIPAGPLGLPLSKEGLAQRAKMLLTGATDVGANYAGMFWGIPTVAADASIRAQKALTSDPAQLEQLDRQQSEIIRDGVLRQQASDQAVDATKNAVIGAIKNAGATDFAQAMQNAPLTSAQEGLATTLADPMTYVMFGAGKAAVAAGEDALQAGVRFQRLEAAQAALKDTTQQMADNAVQHQAFQAVIDSDTAGVAEKISAQKAQAAASADNAAVAQKNAAAQVEFGKAQAAANQELSDMAKPSAVRAAVGGTMQAVGGVMQVPAAITDYLESAPERILEKIAPNLSEDAKAAWLKRAERMASYVGFEHFGPLVTTAVEAAPSIMRTVGRGIAMVGNQLSMGQQTLPFWKSIAENTQGMGSWAASKLDNQLVYAIPDTARGAIHSGTIGAMQGFLTPTSTGGLAPTVGSTAGTMAGAGAGAVMGAAGAGLGQLNKFNSPAELHTASIGDRARFLKGLTPDSVNLYQALSPEIQLAVGSYARAHPDLNMNFFDDPTNTTFNGYHQVINTIAGQKSLINLNVSGDNPLQVILQHETGHHVAANGLTGDVDRYMIGDPVSGQPGLFTQHDSNGNPMTQLDRFNQLEYVPDATFEAYKAKYNSSLPAGTPPEDNHGIAQELFADLHASALSDPKAVQRAVRGYLPDALVGDNALKNWFAKVGVPMDANTGNPILTDTARNIKGLNDLITDFYQRRNFNLDKPDAERGTPRVPVSEFRKGTPEFDRLSHQFDASGDFKRNPDGSLATDLTGRPQLLTPKQADAEHSKLTTTIIKALNAMPAASAAMQDPNTVKLRTDRQGRQFYTGQSMPSEVFQKLTASNQYNSNQLLNLQRLNGTMERNDGTMVKMIYNTASQGGKYGSLPARERVVVPLSYEISPKINQTNIKSFDPEQLQENVTKMMRRKAASQIWDGKIDAVMTDVKTYLDNLANSRAGDTGIGLQKKGVINQLFGFNTDANPTVHQLELKNPSVIKSFRLDRINQLQELPGTTQPFHWSTYEQIRGFMQPRGMQGRSIVPTVAGPTTVPATPTVAGPATLTAPVSREQTVGDVLPDSPIYKDHPWLKNVPMGHVAKKYLSDVSKTL